LELGTLSGFFLLLKSRWKTSWLGELW
jgi:hypothetical protein